MKLLKRILVAADFSKTSDNVIQNAIEMAKAFGAEIALVYVLPEDVGNKKASELLHKFAKKQLDTLNEHINSLGIKTLKPFLEIGEFSEKIIEVSEEINANLIFAGAGEINEVGKATIGFNALKIIKKSDKPVFIVKDGTSLSISKILCPVDFSLESKRALKNAITLAHKFKAELTILSVFEVSQLFPIRDEIEIDENVEFLRKACENNLNNFLKDLNLSGLTVNKVIKAGEPSSEILKTGSEHHTDLLIMGTTGKSGISRILLGSVTENVVYHIPCSFITIKKEDAIVLELEEQLRDIDHHYESAKQLFEDGFFKESIAEYHKCLKISFMHVPSMQGICKVYKKLGDEANEQKYRSMIQQVLAKMNYERIEAEIRRQKGMGTKS